MKKNLLKTLLVAVGLCVGSMSAWALTETFGEGKATTKNTYIIGTAVNIHADSNPSGTGSYAVFNSSTDKGVKLRTNPLKLAVNPGYKVTNVTIYAYQNNESAAVMTCDSYTIDGGSATAFGTAIDIPLNVKNASTQTLATISTGAIDATSSIEFNFTNPDGKNSQILAYIEVTYEEVKNVIYTKSLDGWAAADVTTTEGTVGKWYNPQGVAANDYSTGMLIDATYGLRLAARNAESIATLKLDRTENSIVTIDAVWNVGSATADGNTPNNKFIYGDLTIQQNVRSNNLTTTYKINGTTVTVGTDKFARQDDMTIHLKVNSVTGAISEFYIKNGETTVAQFSELTSTTNHFAGGSNYDEVKMSAWISASSQYAWCALKSITVSEQEQAVYSYTINGKAASTNLKSFATGTNLPGSTIYYHYNQVLNVNGTLYQAAADNSGYKSSFTLDVDNKEVTKSYSQPATPITNLVFLAEGEDLFTRATGSAADTRCSMGAGGYANSKTAFVTLPAGTYYMVLSNRCSGTRTGIHKFYKGDDADAFFSADGNGYNATRESGKFTLSNTTTLYMQGGDSNQFVDWIYIYGTPTNSIVGALDFSTAANGANSEDYTLKPGDTKVFTFQNHGKDFGKNWRIVVKEGATWKANVCADSYDYTANAATKVSYKVSKDGGSTQEALDWTEFEADMADARVVATLAYGLDGTLSITTTSTGVANGYIYYVDQDVTGLTSDLTINLSVNNSWLEVLSVGQTAVGGKIASKGISSLASAYGLDFSAATGLTGAYVVTKTTNEAVTLSSVDEMPANSGVILKGEANAVYSIPVKADAAFSGTNLLQAAVTATDIEANEAYILQGGQFHLVNAASTVPAGKAYLLASNVPSSAPALMFVFADDMQTTGVQDVRSKMADVRGDIFDLQGRKVANPTKGLYIMNGKKVMIK